MVFGFWWRESNRYDTDHGGLATKSITIRDLFDPYTALLILGSWTEAGKGDGLNLYSKIDSLPKSTNTVFFLGQLVDPSNEPGTGSVP